MNIWKIKRGAWRATFRNLFNAVARASTPADSGTVPVTGINDLAARRCQNPRWGLLRYAPRGGFTLIEVLLVIVILLMLMGALVVFILPQQEGAEKNTTTLLLNQVSTALDTYRLNVGRYPTEEEGGLGALLVKPSYENEKLGERWQGPYLKRNTKLDDPWGYKLRYETVDLSLAEDQSGLPYKLYSVGPDGQPDTEDDITLNPSEDLGTTADSTTVLEEDEAP